MFCLIGDGHVTIIVNMENKIAISFCFTIIDWEL
jgi:hypothetical protein